LAIFVGSSVVSAITQTPASGPFGLVTTPPRSLSPIAGAGSAFCCALSCVGMAARSAATPAVIIVRNDRFFVLMSPILPRRVGLSQTKAVYDETRLKPCTERVLMQRFPLYLERQRGYDNEAQRRPHPDNPCRQPAASARSAAIPRGA